MSLMDLILRAIEHRPGAIVTHSGIYAVRHDRYHANSYHGVTVVAGERFPPCNGCGHGIAYVLVRSAVHLRQG